MLPETIEGLAYSGVDQQPGALIGHETFLDQSSEIPSSAEIESRYKDLPDLGVTSAEAIPWPFCKERSSPR